MRLRRDSLLNMVIGGWKMSMREHAVSMGDPRFIFFRHDYPGRDGRVNVDRIDQGRDADEGHGSIAEERGGVSGWYPPIRFVHSSVRKIVWRGLCRRPNKHSLEL
jgi:hypothetical protein